MARRRRVPGYLKHKPSGQAIVVLSGRQHYLGEYGSDESRQEYDRLISEWLANGRTDPAQQAAAADKEQAPATVVEVIAAYVRWAMGHYRRPDGTPTGELTNIKAALRPLRRLYGRTAAKDFGPKSLKAVRQYLLDKRIERK
ncbi:MAG: site-specific integrase, partial [Planctomycetota bacterium]|nr:site-specific integrase [Planctomycetota bacterium]